MQGREKLSFWRALEYSGTSAALETSGWTDPPFEVVLGPENPKLDPRLYTQVGGIDVDTDNFVNPGFTVDELPFEPDEPKASVRPQPPSAAEEGFNYAVGLIYLMALLAIIVFLVGNFGEFVGQSLFVLGFFAVMLLVGVVSGWFRKG